MEAVSVAVVVAVALVALVDEAVLLTCYSVTIGCSISAAAVEHQLFDDQRRGGQPVGWCLLPAPAAAEVGEAAGGGRKRGSSIATLLGPVPTTARAHH